MKWGFSLQMQSPRYKLQNTFSQGLIEYGDEMGQDHLILSMEKMDANEEVKINRIHQ